MHKFDLHIHSKYSSDGTLEPEKIVRIARKRGLSGVAITDHNTILGGLKAKEYEEDGFEVVVGSEIRTDRGEVIGLFLREEINTRSFADVIEEIRDQSGVIVLPHPFDEMRHTALRPSEQIVDLVDSIEVFNARCILQKYNDQALDFAQRFNKGLCAGSDAHFGNEIGNAGIIAYDIQEILKDDIGYFGCRSPIRNHAYTKVLKTWRRFF